MGSSVIADISLQLPFPVIKELLRNSKSEHLCTAWHFQCRGWASTERTALNKRHSLCIPLPAASTTCSWRSNNTNQLQELWSPLSSQALSSPSEQCQIPVWALIQWSTSAHGQSCLSPAELLESQMMHPSAWLDWGTGVSWSHSSEILEQHWFTLTGNAALGLCTKIICHCSSYMTAMTNSDIYLDKFLPVIISSDINQPQIICCDNELNTTAQHVLIW